ncbi:hypothetical protein AB0D29_18590 [Streptomyces sp. NPDC048424]|uniref:hypothetical protein n=1 Tax=Streptomyces sp. NPDC048424 TaxID=3155265 RepID=UPI003446F687
MNAWAALVSVIERGYRDDVYEYTNDLYCRKWLHETWLLLVSAYPRMCSRRYR